ncbi:MAG: glycosyltransferase [Bacteroidia bacterium]|nr:glycosyltransferase [Bacteroidia bacterium]
MLSVLEFIFWLCIALIVHTYVVYPMLMLLVFRQEGVKLEEYEREEELPELSVLIAAYNEEKVIVQKIHSVFNSVYPSSKIHIVVGSDASTDATDRLVDELRGRYPNLQLVRFPGRVGKIGIMNRLVQEHGKGILVLTDANVMFKHQTLYQLVKWFKDERVGLVAANIIKESKNNEGISFQEKKYLSFENLIKSAESKAFQLIMGAEGGCYALRKDLFVPVPAHFIVDDFFITLKVLNSHKFAMFSPTAECTEDVNSDAAGEYRRKVRISSGNFQNLFHFRNNLWPIWKAKTFVFWSHKVLRWLTPFLILIAAVASYFLSLHSLFFMVLFGLQMLGLLLPWLDKLLEFKNPVLKFASHFYLMNMALLQGFFNYVRGIKSSVWQPVERNV